MGPISWRVLLAPVLVLFLGVATVHAAPDAPSSTLVVAQAASAASANSGDRPRRARRSRSSTNEGIAAGRREPSAAQRALRERQKQCGVQWRADKAAGKIASGQKWPQYWSACNKRLKAASR